MAVLSSVAAAVAGRPTKARWLAAWEVIAVAAVVLPDVAATGARQLVAHQPKGTVAPASSKVLAPVLKAAGVLKGAA